MSFQGKWLGQGGFELTDGKVSILLDPYLSDMVERLDNVQRLVPTPIRAQDAHPDLYLITHDHIDHLDADALSVMNKEGIRFAAPTSCFDKLVALGIPANAITKFNRGDTMTFGDFSFEAVYAKHTADSIGFVVRLGALTVYFTGDTEFVEETGKGVSCDILFTCINGRWGNMGITEALQLTERVHATLAIPNHYGMFAENTADPAPFLAGINEQGRKGYLMTHGEWFDLQTLLKN